MVAADRDSAVLCHVQLDESTHNRGCTLRVPGLHPDASYRLAWLGPVDLRATSMSPALSPGRAPPAAPPSPVASWPTSGSGCPGGRPETAQLVHVTRDPGR